MLAFTRFNQHSHVHTWLILVDLGHYPGHLHQEKRSSNTPTFYRKKVKRVGCRVYTQEDAEVKIKQKREGDVMVLHLSGKIMGGPDHEKFHTEVKTLIKEGSIDILLNMSKVNWINSTGLGVLVSAFHTLKKNGGQLKIAEVSERIDNILNVTQLKLVFETFETSAEGLASFAQD